ncbi:MAG: C40 family peptidase [Chitinophagaceae bacterium]|nr:C40 family peptidase [Chitinophagaceae bacterium]
MKHLIFVSVAAGFFSGTSISANAQAAVNSVADTRAINKSPQFIEGIEIRPETSIPPRPPLAASSKDKNTAAARLSARNEASAIEQCSSLQFKYAQLLNMDVEAVTNIELYSFMEKWWGTPYRYGGATKDGIDCSAYSGTLVHDVYGMILSRTARSQYAECEKIKRSICRRATWYSLKTGEPSVMWAFTWATGTLPMPAPATGSSSAAWTKRTTAKGMRGVEG